jgi:proteasome beta subunit
VALPLFHPTEDPGPDFSSLLRRSGMPVVPAVPQGADIAASVRHATTVVALRFADGVVMAGDRRATEGHAIAHRAMEKVFPADRFSAVAIAGAAGFAVEMVRLFQTQLEHYEKVEGVHLSLEGKANQLAQMVRQHLPLAFQGLAVVPLFAGYDTARGAGRIFTYDVTGGHYEEADYQATGSGGRDARTTIKLGFREGLSHSEAVELAIQALYEAADEDSGTGGPDVVRGIYPTVAVVTADGYREVPEEEVAARFQALIDRKRAEREAIGGSSSGGELA